MQSLVLDESVSPLLRKPSQALTRVGVRNGRVRAVVCITHQVVPDRNMAPRSKAAAQDWVIIVNAWVVERVSADFEDQSSAGCDRALKFDRLTSVEDANLGKLTLSEYHLINRDLITYQNSTS